MRGDLAPAQIKRPAQQWVLALQSGDFENVGTTQKVPFAARQRQL
jgi:hypothetical protein